MVRQRGAIVIAAVSGVALCLCGVQAGQWAGSTSGQPIVHLILALLFAAAAGIGCVRLAYTYLKVTQRVSNLFADLKNREITSLDTLPISHTDNTMTIETVVRVLSETLSGHVEQTDRLAVDVRNLQIQTQRSEREKKMLQGVILSLHDGILVLDEKGRVVLVNRAACRIFGFDKTTIIGQRPTSQLSSDKQAFWDKLLLERDVSEDCYKRQVEWHGRKGSRVYHCFVSQFQTSIQQAYGQVIVLRDVTREQEVSDLKNDFVSYVSHELKTPLASITAYAEMLMDNEADNEAMRQSFYAIILSQANRLHRLIEDILNISRIESGLIKVAKSPMSLTVILEEQLQMMRSYAEERNIRLVDCHGVVHDQVYADIDMIRQVIVNLLSNAIKYNRPGGLVTMQIEVDEAQSVARVNITDTGMGIDTEHMDHIFDRFYRVDGGDDKVEGTGLGLCLVKTIVEDIHQGRVFVTSQVGTGSTFGFELPLMTQHDLQAV